VYVHKLGCPKNDVDAEYLAAFLAGAGHDLVTVPEEAESIIVNTCGFIVPAKEESIDEILRLGQLKQTGRLRTLYVSGCLSQRYGDELLRGMPELDGAFGLGELDAIAEAVTSSARRDKTVRTEPRRLGYLDWEQRLLSDRYPYAYLKISDGCDRRCSYCAIPGIRGSYRSRPLKSILREAEFLARSGRKELILVSQEATLWGKGLSGRPDIITLLRELERIDGIAWIRLLYLHPTMVDDALLDYLAADNKTLNYLDLPLQHCSSRILAAMRRKIDGAGTARLLASIRRRSPGATIRTTFIVGFPGETGEDFEELKEFVRRHRFDRMGAFAYSPEEGTAAVKMSGQVPEIVKEERVDELMSLQYDIAVARNNSLIGQTVKVIIDRIAGDGRAYGRTPADCPEVDQEVIIHGEGLQTGQICRVRIDAVDEYDLVGMKLTG